MTSARLIEDKTTSNLRQKFTVEIDLDGFAEDVLEHLENRKNKISELWDYEDDIIAIIKRKK